MAGKRDVPKSALSHCKHFEQFRQRVLLLKASNG